MGQGWGRGGAGVGQGWGRTCERLAAARGHGRVDAAGVGAIGAAVHRVTPHLAIRRRQVLRRHLCNREPPLAEMPRLRVLVADRGLGGTAGGAEPLRRRHATTALHRVRARLGARCPHGVSAALLRQGSRADRFSLSTESDWNLNTRLYWEVARASPVCSHNLNLRFCNRQPERLADNARASSTIIHATIAIIQYIQILNLVTRLDALTTLL